MALIMKIWKKQNSEFNVNRYTIFMKYFRTLTKVDTNKVERSIYKIKMNLTR